MSQTYERPFTVKDEHVDFQGIVDGLYYPFYMEDCRHQYIKDVLGIDLHGDAAAGVNWVLSQSLVKFRRSLTKGDQFSATCSAHPDKSGRPVVHFRQTIVRGGKLVTEGLFTATCVKAAGGRSYLPAEVTEKLASAEPVESPDW